MEEQTRLPFRPQGVQRSIFASQDAAADPDVLLVVGP